MIEANKEFGDGIGVETTLSVEQLAQLELSFTDHTSPGPSPTRWDEARLGDEGSCFDLMIAEEQGASVSLTSMTGAAFQAHMERGHELEDDMKLAKDHFEEYHLLYEQSEGENTIPKPTLLNNS